MNQTKKTTTQPSNAEEQAEIESALRLAKEYWLRTVQPYIVGRKLRGVELFIASDAHSILKAAIKRAATWNNFCAIVTKDLPRSPVSLDVNLSAENFREPEELFADKNLKPDLLAKIAAPLMNKSKGKMTPAEAVRNAYELLMAAERYIRTLPQEQQGTESVTGEIDLALSPVTFNEILRSNEKDSGQLPFLPPVQKGRNEGRLTLEALKIAVTRFLQGRTNSNHVSQLDYLYDEEQDDEEQDEIDTSGNGKISF